MLADSVLLHAQRRMIAASPSDHQLDRVVLDPHNDLLDQRTDDSFPSSRTIVRVSRIVDAILIDDQRADQAAKLE